MTILPCQCGCIKQATTCTTGNNLPGRPFLSLIGYDKHRHCLFPLDPLPTLASERSALRMFLGRLDWTCYGFFIGLAGDSCCGQETTTIPATNSHQWYQPTVSAPSNHCHCASNWRSSIFTTHEFLLDLQQRVMVVLLHSCSQN